MVTYRQVDPLFILDLSDIDNPAKGLGRNLPGFLMVKP